MATNNATTITTLDALLHKLNITHNDWDALLIGDGSGSQWHKAIGWGVVLIDRHTAIRDTFWGASNRGTSTIAEILPYLHALMWYVSDGPGKYLGHKRVAINDNVKIHVVTDNMTVAQCGNNPESRRTHKALWAAIDAFRQDGIIITFHHIKRMDVTMNVVMDLLSKEARITMNDCFKRVQTELNKKYSTPVDASIYDFL